MRARSATAADVSTPPVREPADACDAPGLETVYDRVLKFLFGSGAVEPGGRVVETQLAAQLGVSRIPVREALGRLRGQGLLVSDGRGRGMRLRRYSTEDIANFYDYREVLEGGAARAAARRATPQDIARLVEITERQDELATGAAFELPEWQASDHAFHVAVADAGHNERVIRGLQHLLAELHGIFYGPMHHHFAAARGRTLERSEAIEHALFALREHRSILSAVRSGDADLAERRARRHIRNAARRLRVVMDSATPAPAGARAARD
jgi:DNA-binding GntR family transcriptional regulator